MERLEPEVLLGPEEANNGNAYELGVCKATKLGTNKAEGQQPREERSEESDHGICHLG